MGNTDRSSIQVFVIAAPLLAWSIEQIITDARPHLELAGAAADLVVGLERMRRQRADVAVMLMDREGPRELADFCAASPAKVLVVIDSADDARLDGAVRGGVRGVLSTRESPAALVKAIEKIHEGELWIDRGATSRIFLRMARRKAEEDGDADHSRVATLTLRERQTVAAVARHVSAPGKVIAERLCISEHTLRNHLSSIYAKLGLSSRLDLYAYATSHNLCVPD